MGDGSAARTHESTRPSLLTTLTQDLLDPGYADAAARKAGRDRPDRRAAARNAGPHRPDRGGAAMLLVALVAVGILLGVAAGAADRGAEGSAAARDLLLTDIAAEQARQAELTTAAAVLAVDVRLAQERLGVLAPPDRDPALQVAAGLAAVQGPGLRIVLDQPAATAEPDPAPDAGAAAPAQPDAVILYRDLQLLVNGLWASGAEAVAIGGVRLRPASSIRQAGGAMLVDNRPVFWPIAVEAIGGPALPADLGGTPGFRRFALFAEAYGVRFDVAAADPLTLAAGTAADPRYARTLPR